MTAERSLGTVLFTDIVGSTVRAAELGDARWRELLERHHALVRRWLKRYSGALGYRRWHQTRSDHGRAPFVSSRSHAPSATS